MENKSSTLDRVLVPKEDLVLSLFLVQVAIRQYKEGKFWKVFNEQLELEISAAKQNYLGQIFIRTIQKYNLYELSKEEANIQMYVENIKAHAFVANYYMKGFLILQMPIMRTIFLDKYQKILVVN